MRRRPLLIGLGAFAAASTSSFFGFGRLARPALAEGPLSKEATALAARAWEGLDPARVIDSHVHVVGLGDDGSGCWVNERMRSPLSPVSYLRFSIYCRAAGVDPDQEAGRDASYMEVLGERARMKPMGGRLLLLPFDQAYGEDGHPLPESSEFHTPNDYVLGLCRAAPDLFLPAASIHPYRADAVDELHRLHEAGVRAVKWLPNAMNIAPGEARCDPFYAALAKLDVPLLTHAGEEKAVHAEEAQRLGNPLHLRRALDAGVKVICAHAASLGANPDLDKPGAPDEDNFTLFLRLIDDPRYRGRLFADISAMTQFNRCAKLGALLERSDLHGQLINGSDYPLPAINALVRTGTLVDQGYISEEERVLLNEIDRHNPLAFDLVLKRTVAVRRGGKTHRFADQVFMPELFQRA